MRIFLALVGFSLFGCSTKTPLEVLKKKQINGFSVEANFINDTIIDGTANFFKEDRLAIKEQYKWGIRNGFSLNYYSNGAIYDSSNYINGYKEGYYFVYDSLGNIRYRNYFYRGDQIGSEFYFDNNGITNYYFYSKERKILYSWWRDSSNALKSEGDFYNTFPLEIYKGRTLHYGVFAYLIHPPKMNVTYELIAMKSGQEISLRKFNQEVFFDTTFLPNKYYDKYFMKIIADDSVGGKGKVYYDELVYEK